MAVRMKKGARRKTCFGGRFPSNYEYSLRSPRERMMRYKNDAHPFGLMLLRELIALKPRLEAAKWR